MAAATSVSAAPTPGEKAAQVWQLEIEGNEAFSDIIIKDQIATDAFSFWEKLKFWDRSGHKLDKIEIRKDVIRIRNYYNRRGFPRTKVSYRIETVNKPWKKRVVFTINEREAIKISDISFTFENSARHREFVTSGPAFRAARRRSEYQVGQRYEPIKQAEVTGSYRQTLENMGFAYTSVDIKTRIDTTRLAADLTIQCTLGPMTYIDQIAVSGDSTISDKYIIRESGLRKGEKYSREAIEEAQREIFNHHLFRFATISIPDQPKDSTLNLAMRVRENELRSVEASLGFGIEEYLRGQVSWAHRNAFGRGHRFTAAAKASYIEQALSLDYLFPYAFNTKSSFVVSPFAQHLLEDSYELTQIGITNSLIYRYSRRMTGSLSYQLTRNSELSIQEDVNLPDTTQNYNLSSIQLSGYYNQALTNRGQKGWLVQPYLEVSGFLGTSTFQFQKLSIDIRRYTPLTPTTTLATRIQGGKIFAAREDSLPNNIRYYLGGTNSVRGWGRYQLGPKRVVTDSIKSSNGEAIADSTIFSRYVPTGGRTYFAFNLEIRQDIDALINNVGLTAFLDGGQVWRKHPDIKSRPLQFGIGGGIRYASPIGPVRLDIGYKINPSAADLNKYRNQNFGSVWDRIGIHLSVGQAF